MTDRLVSADAQNPVNLSSSSLLVLDLLCPFCFSLLCFSHNYCTTHAQSEANDEMCLLAA